MSRYLVFAALLSCLLSTAPASADDVNQVQTVKLQLVPAGPVAPALKYRLLPLPLEQNDGNAAPMYLKAALLLRENHKHSEHIEKISKWLELPLDELPRDEVRKLLATYISPLEMLRIGARRRDCNWDPPIREQNVFSILLPEMNSLRELARLVALQGRLRVAEGDFAGAAESLKTEFALGRHVARTPFLICGLVGLAIHRHAIGVIQDWVQQAGSPNLYWSLAALPRPLIDLRDALEMEASSVFMILPKFQDVETLEQSPEQWQAMLIEAVAALGSFEELTVAEQSKDRARLTASLGAVALSLKGYSQAKRDLLTAGYSRERVEAMSVPQVMLIAAKLGYEEVRDEYFKWSYLPFAEGDSGLQRADELLKRSRQREAIPIAALLMPALGRVSLAQTRSLRDVDMLRCVEALRAHAAENGGRLPPKLTDITALPLPRDPYTAAPFEYSAQDGQAKLDSLPPKVRPSSQGLRYEISVRGAK